ncbi:cell wall hydrolase [Paenibacillus antri]|uniref:Cell wall hydrolase n=1 Tax=Paenibacillus antri TaxID=2582848 RepID=A0A5R9GCW7_9BACL|nr:cell wall hydrolase [Paenibacillus antri]TLS51920.1 cell wall hydrolase [Paenibacillus antri]
MNQAAVLTLLALILSNALVVANNEQSTGYENPVQHPVSSVEAIRTESGQEAGALESADNPTTANVAAGPPSVSSEPSDVSSEEVELLARIVSAEAKNEPYKGQVAVAAVVLNRVEEEGFGDSIEEVIYSKGQFQPVSNGTIHKEPVDSAYQAAEEALHGKDPTNGAIYFANMDIADHHPNPKAKKTVKIGDHTFYK